MSGFVLITRHPSECRGLQSLLDPCGLKLRPYPVLRLSDVHDEKGWKTVMERVPDFERGAWLVMASPRAPERFVAECDRRGGNTLLELPVAAVGNSTAASARSANLRVELVGSRTLPHALRRRAVRRARKHRRASRRPPEASPARYSCHRE